MFFLGSKAEVFTVRPPESRLMESFTMSLKPTSFGCPALASALASLRLGEFFSGLCTKGSSLMYGGSCWTDLLASIDEKDEQEEEEQEALDDSIERLLFSVMLLLNVFSCKINPYVRAMVLDVFSITLFIHEYIGFPEIIKLL
jgi:hypothetical protein